MRINGKIFILVLMIAVALWYALLLEFSPLPLHIIDRDKSGIVSFIEALDSADIGKRAVDGKPNCIEYFWLKDGYLLMKAALMLTIKSANPALSGTVQKCAAP